MSSDEVLVGPTIDDLASRPWEYPGRAPRRSGLLVAGRYRPLADAPNTRLTSEAGGESDSTPTQTTLQGLLAAAGAAPIQERSLVVAVGSNASPAVLHRKLEARGVDTTVPFARVRLDGMRVGHSAHVSRAGFIAATPVLAPAQTVTMACLLDERQLRCIDDTEPNYVRTSVDAATCSCTFDDGSTAPDFEVYQSHWHALAQPGFEPTPKTSQSLLYQELLADCPPLTDVVGELHDPRAVMRLLSSDQVAREAVRDAWRDQGWAHPGGFA